MIKSKRKLTVNRLTIATLDFRLMDGVQGGQTWAPSGCYLGGGICDTDSGIPTYKFTNGNSCEPDTYTCFCYPC